MRMNKHVLFSLMVIALTLAMAVPLMVAAPAMAATTWYVDASYAGTETGSATEPFNTIQEAIDAAATTGDTISVANGTYTEALTIDGKGLIITGETESGVVVQATASPPDSANNTFSIGYSTTCAGKTITIQTMTIRNGKYGIRSKDGDVNVLHCTFVHNGWNGTGIGAATQPEMLALWASSSTSDGGAIRIQNSTSSEIAYCTVYENARAIRYQDGDSGDIHDNESYNNLESGIYLASLDKTATYGCTNTNVYDNTVYGNMNNGILVIAGKTNSVYDNNIYDNWNTGVMLWHGGEVTIEDNTIKNNNLKNFNGIGNSGDAKGGVWIVGNTIYTGSTFVAKILNNTIDDTQIGGLAQQVGVHISNPVPSAGIEVKGNTFTNHDVDVLVEDQAATTVVNNNNLSGTTYGVQNTDTSATLDAENNWWGAIDGPGSVGPGSGVPVSTNVDYDPWETAFSSWNQGQFEIGAPPVVNVTSSPTDMNPQVEQTVTVNVSMPNSGESLSDLDSLTFKTYFDTGSGTDPTEFDSKTNHTQTCAVITWTSGGGFSVAPSTNTTWSLGTCTAPTTMSSSSGDFTLKFKPGKVAKESTGGECWQIGASATSMYGTGYDNDTNAQMNFYGEIQMGAVSVDWGLMAAGQDFGSTTARSVGSITYISNGNFDRKAKSDATWSGAASNTAHLDGVSCAGGNEFALKAGNVSSHGAAFLVTSTGAVFDDTGIITVETGATDSPNYLWLKTGATFAPDTYTGAITYMISAGS